MQYGLGIDAGGTYTDAVIVNFSSHEVLAKAKALTTKEQLSIGIAGVIAKLPAELLAKVQLVSLSTTLATNAIVEGKGGKVGAILLGFNIYEAAKVKLTPVRHVAGRTDITGVQMQALDEVALRVAIRELLDDEQVDALAISAMVSVKNPAHEIRARQIAEEMTEKPIVCGHEISMQLDTIKRTNTAVLNARLLPIIADLIHHVLSVMREAGIKAPLMVVRGDGTLMSAEMSRLHPVETVLSGPASSVCGGQFLSHLENGLVVDIGGTTSDIALIIDGNPIIASKGAHVGHWSTNVRAVDINTIGLGGDSVVSINNQGGLMIGPRRAIPLAYLAREYPGVLKEMQQLWQLRDVRSTLIQPIEFFVRVRKVAGVELSVREVSTLQALQQGPLSREQLATAIGAMAPSLVPVTRLETAGYIQRSTVTPTDVLHYLNIFTDWNCEAAELGLKIFAYRAGVTVAQLAPFILETFAFLLTKSLLQRVIRYHHHNIALSESKFERVLLDMLVDHTDMSGLSLRANYQYPLVAIGAPAAALAVQAAGKLGAELIIPPHAEVANAVGAIVGMLQFSVEATISPSQHGFVIHSPTERREFTDLNAAQEWGSTHLLQLLEDKITQGAMEHFTFHREVQSHTHNADTKLGHVFIESTMRAVAIGKPDFTT